MVLCADGDLPDASVLTAGLGNPEMTSDSLGPQAAGNLCITRNLRKAGRVSAIVPGVMAQTGMEAAEIIRGVVKETRPDVLLVIDALAARSVRRLGTTIQLTDTGIQPGSGVGITGIILTGFRWGFRCLPSVCLRLWEHRQSYTTR